MFSEEVRSEQSPVDMRAKSFPDGPGGANTLGLIGAVCSVKSKDPCGARGRTGGGGDREGMVRACRALWAEQTNWTTALGEGGAVEPPEQGRD